MGRFRCHSRAVMHFPWMAIGIAFFAGSVFAADVAGVLVADGFDAPVGRPSGAGYYLSRGYRANGHLGEDWNGKGGGDTDLGAPVFSVAHGIVVFAQDYGHGWGNVVIVRHVYEENGVQKYVDSLYGHLDRITVSKGQLLRRGSQLGTIGTGGGLYPAHLHLEMRKDIRVGMARHRFPQDDQVYWSPVAFMTAHRRMRPGTAVAMVPMNTFVAPDGAGVAEKGIKLPVLPQGMVLPPVRKPAGTPKRP